MEILKVMLAAILLVAFSVVAISIRMLLKKGATFRKSCSSVDPVTGKRIGCTCGSHDPDDCHHRKEPKP
ncbi:MAG: hypothetical protein JW861_14410 [Bacteroidales bacterium]|nr:hypothetical protein [Bacteroidales bacterium]